MNSNPFIMSRLHRIVRVSGVLLFLAGASLAAQQQAPEGAPSPQAVQAAPQPGGALLLPAGTLITVRLNQPLSSDHNQPGDGFTAVLDQPLVANGLVVARRGQTAVGRVNVAEKGGRVKGVSRLGIELGELTFVDGQQLPIRTELLENRGPTSVGRDAGTIGTTTATGAAIGAAVNNGAGAGAGAAAGLAASVAGVLLSRGRQTVIYPETLLTFRIVAPVTIWTDRSAGVFQPATRDDYGTPQLTTRYAAPPPPPVYYAPYPYYDYYPRFYTGYGFGPSFYFHSGPRSGFHGGRGHFRR